MSDGIQRSTQKPCAVCPATLLSGSGSFELKPVIPGLEQLRLQGCRFSIEVDGQGVGSLSSVFHHNKERNIAVPRRSQLNRLRPCEQIAVRLACASVCRNSVPIRPRALVFRKGIYIQGEQQSTGQNDKYQAWKDEILASHTGEQDEQIRDTMSRL